MVQKKGAKTEIQELNDFLAKEAERYRKSVIDTVWFVVEHTPGYNTGGYYDQDVDPVNRKVSPDFSEKSEAIAWRDEHEPDEGNKLLIAHQDKTRRVYEEWGGWFMERA